MVHPAFDLEDRARVWDCMQHFWMDTDPNILLEETARICAESKYSLEELELIFWNEVKPAVSFNLLMLPVPEWTGFEVKWLKERVLKKHRFGRSLRWRWLDPYSCRWWKKLRAGIENIRE